MLKGSPFGLFEISVCCKINKVEGGPFGDKQNVREKSRPVPKNVKGGTLQSRPALYLTLKIE